MSPGVYWRYQFILPLSGSVLIDIGAGNEARKVISHAGRNGFLYTLQRRSVVHCTTLAVLLHRCFRRYDTASLAAFTGRALMIFRRPPRAARRSQAEHEQHGLIAHFAQIGVDLVIRLTPDKIATNCLPPVSTR
jgi:hypothetical protein